MLVPLFDPLLLALLTNCDRKEVEGWRFDLDSITFECSPSVLSSCPLVSGILQFNSNHFLPDLDAVKLVHPSSRVIIHEPLLLLIDQYC